LTGTAPALALVLGITLAACRAHRAPAVGGAVAVVDDAGDTVRLQVPARRIVSLIPTTTEILVGAGLVERVVGRTEWCDWPAAVATIPSVGGGFPPNVEAVAARRPDLVVLYRTAANRPAAAQLEALGIPVLELRTDRIADIPRVARLLGALTGERAAIESVAREFERDLADASRGLPADRPAGPPTRPVVVLLAWPDPAVALGAGAFMSELLELAGGRNAFGDLPAASAPVSLEAIVARDPSAVFLADRNAAPLLARPEWQTVRAVRTGRVLTPLVPGLTRAGLRAPAAVAQLRRHLARLGRPATAALNPSPSKARP
jgi:iron complex transport system substrate-binding protein